MHTSTRRLLIPFILLLVVTSCAVQAETPLAGAVARRIPNGSMHLFATMAVDADWIDAALAANDWASLVRWPAFEAEGFEIYQCFALVERKFDSFEAVDEFMGIPPEPGIGTREETNANAYASWLALPPDFFETPTAVRIVYADADGREIQLRISFGWPDTAAPPADSGLLSDAVGITENGMVFRSTETSIQFISQADLPLLKSESSWGGAIVYSLSSNDLSVRRLVNLVKTK